LGDVLSQAEIDSLLSSLSTGTVSADTLKEDDKGKKIKIYDFKRPDKFSKDQMRTLFMLHENFARMLNTYLSAHLRTIVQIDVASVDQLTYEEFIRSVPNPSVISIFQMRPLKGNAIFEINVNLMLSIIDRLFGGTGAPPPKPRALTDIEETIARRIISKAMESFQEAWKQVIPIEPKLETIETNPQFTQIVPPNDMVVLITLQTKVGHAEGFISICIPYLVLETVMSKLTTTFWVASSTSQHSTPEVVKSLEERLKTAKIPVIAQLGKTTITVQELLMLTRGDVLKLTTKTDHELAVVVGSKEKFMCKPGLIDKKSAIQITKVISQGDDKDE
jgi:flagellar motor switch protein FliM